MKQSAPGIITYTVGTGGGESHFGIQLTHAVQPNPEGTVLTITIGRDIIGDDACAMVPGDIIFHGNESGAKLGEAGKKRLSQIRGSLLI